MFSICTFDIWVYMGAGGCCNAKRLTGLKWTVLLILLLCKIYRHTKLKTWQHLNSFILFQMFIEFCIGKHKMNIAPDLNIKNAIYRTYICSSYKIQHTKNEVINSSFNILTVVLFICVPIWNACFFNWFSLKRKQI